METNSMSFIGEKILCIKDHSYDKKIKKGNYYTVISYDTSYGGNFDVKTEKGEVCDGILCDYFDTSISFSENVTYYIGNDTDNCIYQTFINKSMTVDDIYNRMCNLPLKEESSLYLIKIEGDNQKRLQTETEELFNRKGIKQIRFNATRFCDKRKFAILFEKIIYRKENHRIIMGFTFGGKKIAKEIKSIINN
jgi:hypothetical protein